MKRSPHSPWLEIPLADYERHMSSPSVAQAALLADTLRRLAETYRPKSLALLGSAGGNGLECIDPLVTRRVVAVDLNAAFLEACAVRHAARFDKFETVHCDLSDGLPFTDPVELAVAALVIEYVELDSFLDYAPSLVTNDGRTAFVFQDHDGRESPVTGSGVLSVQALGQAHSPVDVAKVMDVLQSRGMVVEERRVVASAPGKRFTLLVMAKH
jgi:hypothetical protein